MGEVPLALRRHEVELARLLDTDLGSDKGLVTIANEFAASQKVSR